MRSVPAVSIAALLAMAATVRGADLDEIRSKGRVRVLVGTGEQPEMFAFDGPRPGFERELLEGFARFHKVELAVIPVRDRAERIPALRRGEGDLLVGLVATPEREQSVTFSIQVLSAPHVVVNVAPKPPIRSLEEVRKARFGVLPGASWVADLAAAGVPPAATVSYPSRSATLTALRRGEVNATVMSLFNFALLDKESPGLQLVMRLGADRRSAWAMRKEDVELRKAVDSYLALSQSSMGWSRLVVKYFGERALEVLNRGGTSKSDDDDRGGDR